MRWIFLSLLTLRLEAQPVNFNKQIAPLIFQHCSPCHRPGEAAPFSLLSYDDVRKHAAQIVTVTERGYMPPWPPESGYGDFAGERRLSGSDVELIKDWVNQGKSEGDPADRPTPPTFSEGWQLGPPDLIVQIPKPYRLVAAGRDVFRNFVIPVPVKQTMYVQAVEMRPGNKRVVHHANLWIDHRQVLRKRDGQESQPGFPGMDVGTEARSDAFDPDSHFLFWKPGTVLQREADDMAWRLDPGTDLILNMHLLPSGKEEEIQPVIGFYFTSHRPTRHPMLIQLEHDGALDIPAESRNFEVEDHLKLPIALQVLAIYPHAHYLGKQVEAWATLPDGTRRWLIKILDWDINWQGVYVYREPVELPKGSVIAMRIRYDNSATNARNPHQPPKRVRTGPRSEDEMGHVWLQVLPQREATVDGRLVLQEAGMRRRLEKYPGDFVAHCNLGALLTVRQSYTDAVSEFQQALKVEPQSATARNGLGAGLLAEGHFEEAIEELQEAIRLDSSHVNAQLNLARAFGGKGNWASAIDVLNQLLTQKPENVDARVGLGMAYFMQQRFEKALPYFEEAARLRPEDADIQTQLGVVLASRGDFKNAASVFEKVLKLSPNHATARSYLERARAAMRNSP